MQDAIYILTQVSAYSMIVPLGAGLVRMRQLLPMQSVLLAMLTFVLVNQLAATIMWEVFQVPNIPLYHLYTAVEAVLLLVVFRGLFLRSDWKFAATALMPVVPLVLVVDIAFGGGLQALPTQGRTVEALIMIGCSAAYLFQVGQQRVIKRLERDFGFWMATSMLVYFPANTLLFAFNNYIGEADNSVIYSLWGSHAVVNVLLYLCYTPALICRETR